MPMYPNDGENQSAFMGRCMQHELKDKGAPYKQAVAICMSKWSRKDKEDVLTPKEASQKINDLVDTMTDSGFEQWAADSANKEQLAEWLVVSLSALDDQSQKADWEEAKHPRDHGKFSSKYGASDMAGGKITAPRRPIPPYFKASDVKDYGGKPGGVIDAFAALANKQKLTRANKQALLGLLVVSLPKIASGTLMAVGLVDSVIKRVKKVFGFVSGIPERIRAHTEKADLSYFDVKDLADILDIPEDDVEDFISDPSNLDLLSSSTQRKVDKILDKDDGEVPDSMPNMKRFMDLLNMDKDKFYEWLGTEERGQEWLDTLTGVMDEGASIANKRDFIRDARGRFSHVAGQAMESQAVQTGVNAAQNVAAAGSVAFGSAETARWAASKVAPIVAKISPKIAARIPAGLIVKGVQAASVLLKAGRLARPLMAALKFVPCPPLAALAWGFTAADIALNVVGPLAVDLYKDKFMNQEDKPKEKADIKLRSSGGRFDTWKGSLNRISPATPIPGLATSVFQENKVEDPVTSDLDDAYLDGDLPALKKAIDILSFKDPEYEKYFNGPEDDFDRLLEDAITEMQTFALKNKANMTVEEWNASPEGQKRPKDAHGNWASKPESEKAAARKAKARAEAREAKQTEQGDRPTPFQRIPDNIAPNKLEEKAAKVAWWLQTAGSIYENASAAAPYVMETIAAVGALYTAWKLRKNPNWKPKWTPKPNVNKMPKPPDFATQSKARTAATGMASIPPKPAAKPKAPPKPKAAPKKTTTAKKPGAVGPSPAKKTTKEKKKTDSIPSISSGYGYTNKWEEVQHPRDSDGKFADVSGESGNTIKKPSRKRKRSPEPTTFQYTKEGFKTLAVQIAPYVIAYGIFRLFGLRRRPQSQTYGGYRPGSRERARAAEEAAKASARRHEQAEKAKESARRAGMSPAERARDTADHLEAMAQSKKVSERALRKGKSSKEANELGNAAYKTVRSNQEHAHNLSKNKEDRVWPYYTFVSYKEDMSSADTKPLLEDMRDNIFYLISANEDLVSQTQDEDEKEAIANDNQALKDFLPDIDDALNNPDDLKNKAGVAFAAMGFDQSQRRLKDDSMSPKMMELMSIIDDPMSYEGTADEFEQLCKEVLDEMQSNKMDWKEWNSSESGRKNPKRADGKFGKKNLPALREASQEIPKNRTNMFAKTVLADTERFLSGEKKPNSSSTGGFSNEAFKQKPNSAYADYKSRQAAKETLKAAQKTRFIKGALLLGAIAGAAAITPTIARKIKEFRDKVKPAEKGDILSAPAAAKAIYQMTMDNLKTCKKEAKDPKLASQLTKLQSELEIDSKDLDGVDAIHADELNKALSDMKAKEAETIAIKFDEAQHPRDATGQWVEEGGVTKSPEGGASGKVNDPHTVQVIDPDYVQSVNKANLAGAVAKYSSIVAIGTAALAALPINRRLRAVGPILATGIASGIAAGLAATTAAYAGTIWAKEKINAYMKKPVDMKKGDTMSAVDKDKKPVENKEDAFRAQQDNGLGFGMISQAKECRVPTVFLFGDSFMKPKP